MSGAYFLDTDAGGEPTIWRHTDREDRPEPVLQRFRLTDRTQWDRIVNALLDDEHADILAELAETQAALHAATNDVVRLAAELHTAHAQTDRVRALATFAVYADFTDAHESAGDVVLPAVPAADLLAALDGGAS